MNLNVTYEIGVQIKGLVTSYCSQRQNGFTVHFQVFKLLNLK